MLSDALEAELKRIGDLLNMGDEAYNKEKKWKIWKIEIMPLPSWFSPNYGSPESETLDFSVSVDIIEF